MLVTHWYVVDFIFLESTPNSEIASSYNSYVFRLLRNFHTAFPSGYTNLCSDQQCVRVPLSLYPQKHRGVMLIRP